MEEYLDNLVQNYDEDDFPEFSNEQNKQLNDIVYLCNDLRS